MDLELRFDLYSLHKNRPLLAILTSFRYPWQVSKKGHSNKIWQFLQNKVIFDGHVFCIDDISKVTFHLIYTYQNISSLGYRTSLAFYMLPEKSAIFAYFNLAIFVTVENLQQLVAFLVSFYLSQERIWIKIKSPGALRWLLVLNLWTTYWQLW